MRIAITADHNGVAMKQRLATWLDAQGHEVDDRAAEVSAAEIVDYPRLCEDVCRLVVEGEADFAVVIGGGGSGETIACNKIHGIRAALVLEPFIAEVSRANNDANVFVTGAKVLDAERAERLLATWLATPFKGARHQRRLEQIAALERGESLL